MRSTNSRLLISSRSAGPKRIRWGVALLVPVFLFPNYSPNYLDSTERLPRFFSSGLYHQWVRPGENVLLVPAQNRGDFILPDAMVIQAETGFSFRMLVGYTGPLPPSTVGHGPCRRYTWEPWKGSTR